MSNVANKASKFQRQHYVDEYEKKSEKSRKQEFDVLFKFSKKKTFNRRRTPLSLHAVHAVQKDEKCKQAFGSHFSYWQHLLVLLKQQEGLCANMVMSVSFMVDRDLTDPRK